MKLNVSPTLVEHAPHGLLNNVKIIGFFVKQSFHDMKCVPIGYCEKNFSGQQVFQKMKCLLSPTLRFLKPCHVFHYFKEKKSFIVIYYPMMEFRP